VVVRRLSGGARDVDEMTQITADIGHFIERELAADGVGAIEPADDLLELGVLDSAGIAQLIAYVEERYGILVEDSELVVENFVTVGAVAAFVESKLATQV
jgi:acyl carrier protein